MNTCRCAVLVAVSTAFLAHPQKPAAIQETFANSHRWFELRAEATAQSPLRLRAVLAAAFNDPAAESLLRRVIRETPRSPAADDALAMLARVYIRSGQYARFASLYEEWRRLLPESELLRGERENYDKFRQRPNQINGPRKPSRLRHQVDGYPMLPIVIDTHAEEFIFDTGAWQSAVTDRMASKLGLDVSDVGRSLTDIAGNRVSFRTAVAKDVAIGNMRFQNVSFAVISPQGPLAEVEFGIIGMPLILAMGGITWSNDGSATFGDAPRPSQAREANLVFDERLVVRASVLDRFVNASLDTGANTTELNANFADMFPDVVAKGRKASGSITGIGGTQTYESIELAELRILLGGKPVIARPGVVTMQRHATGGGACCIGNFGHDLLKQGAGFTIDLTTMTLVLR